jgi:amidase
MGICWTLNNYTKRPRKVCPFKFNMSGQPAMSVPLAWNAAGLPLGMMFSARFGDEATLFRLAAQLERERPWKDKLPPVCA